MEYTFEQARERVRRKLDSMPGGKGFRIVDASVLELQEGWVFGYQSAGFLETGKISNSLAGNNPLFVAKSDGEIFFLSQHRPLAETMAAYRASGDPNATLVPAVELLGWKPGANAVAAIQGIRRHCSVGLAEAKSIIDRCIEASAVSWRRLTSNKQSRWLRRLNRRASHHASDTRIDEGGGFDAFRCGEPAQS